jgi:tetratricopeptide (TPR) repeat protein
MSAIPAFAQIKSAKGFFLLGCENLSKNDYVEAMRNFANVVALDSKDANAYNNIAILHSMNNDLMSAKMNFNQAISINQKNWIIYFNRGITRYNLNDYKGAIQDFNKVISLDSANAEAWFNLGNCKFRINDFRGAINNYSKALDLNPKFADAWYNRGVSKDKMELGGADVDFKKADEINPKLRYNQFCDATKTYFLDFSGKIIGDKPIKDDNKKNNK